MGRGPGFDEREALVVAREYPVHGATWGRWWCNGGDLLPGRSRASIHQFASANGVRFRSRRGSREWSEAEDCAALLDLAELAADLDRSPAAVVNRLARLMQRQRMRRRLES